MSGLSVNTRFTVAIGVFSGVGPNYSGQVQTIGSTGFTVDDLVVGDGLFDGKSMYLVNSVTVDSPGNIATLDVTYQAGGADDSPPAGSRGQITHLTGNLGLALVTRVDSNSLTPDQLAIILTSNFLKIDNAVSQSGSSNVYNTSDTVTSPREVLLGGHTFTFKHGAMEVVIDPSNLMVKVDGADVEILDPLKGIVQSDGTTRWRKTMLANGCEVKTSL